MTIHKSQGCTFDCVRVGMTPRMSRSLQYVGLSRVTKANGLYILNDYYPPATAKEDDPLTKELKRLESAASDPIFAFLYKRKENYSYQFMYHNVQAHHEDLSSDQSFMHTDLLLLAETWTIRSDRFEFLDFKLCRNPFESNSYKKA
ncbi:ATP-dependent DNA helicase [Caerostris extrusa]|uniref:ATP-dependent DNA helicase n=1 Tax=Caerostris extrusa TaxID=172846 RepID=A0AAV4U8X8_CAEEX|nr:ATP-dependent DNA helicase [Caerostris extrusa]